MDAAIQPQLSLKVGNMTYITVTILSIITIISIYSYVPIII